MVICFEYSIKIQNAVENNCSVIGHHKSGLYSLFKWLSRFKLQFIVTEMFLLTPSRTYPDVHFSFPFESSIRPSYPEGLINNPILAELPWLPVNYTINFKIILVVF